LGLAVEQGGAGDFVTAEGLGNGFEGEVLLLLCGEEERGGGGKAWNDRLLGVLSCWYSRIEGTVLRRG